MKIGWQLTEKSTKNRDRDSQPEVVENDSYLLKQKIQILMFKQ